MDAIWPDLWPTANEPPARNLFTGDVNSGIGRCLIARHGSSSPKSAPRNVPGGQRLPGAINLSCADGHVERAPLEKLWDFFWHRDYQAPAKHPL